VQKTDSRDRAVVPDLDLI